MVYSKAINALQFRIGKVVFQLVNIGFELIEVGASQITLSYFKLNTGCPQSSFLSLGFRLIFCYVGLLMNFFVLVLSLDRINVVTLNEILNFNFLFIIRTLVIEKIFLRLVVCLYLQLLLWFPIIWRFLILVISAGLFNVLISLGVIRLFLLSQRLEDSLLVEKHDDACYNDNE